MDLCELGYRYLEAGNFAEAKRQFAYARRQDDTNFAVWFGLALCITRNFTKYTGENWQKFVDTAKRLAPSQTEIDNMDRTIGDYAQKMMIIRQNM